MSHFIQARSLPSSFGSNVPPRAAPGRQSARHELHRAVDRDWEAGGPGPADARGTAAASLAALATLPTVSLLLEALSHASPVLVAAVASLPLAALLLVAVTWRSEGGRP